MSKRYKNFQEFNKKLKKAEGLIPELFEKTAKKAGIMFVNNAKDETDKVGLVDTGNYKRNWTTDIGTQANKYWIVKCYNPVEYASFLEYGHKLRNGKRWRGQFVGTRSLKIARNFAIKELRHELGDLYEGK